MSAGAFISAVCDEIWFVTRPPRGSSGPRPPSGDRPGRRRDDEGEARQLPEGADAGDLRGQGLPRRGHLGDDRRRHGAQDRRRGGQDRREADQGEGRTAVAHGHRGDAGRTARRPGRSSGAGDRPRTWTTCWRRNSAPAATSVDPARGDLVRGPGVWLNRLAPACSGSGIWPSSSGSSRRASAASSPGVALLTVVFLGSYVSGLSGHEPVILFSVGLVLLLLELLFFHSAGFLGVVGFLLMLGSLFWAMADLWPGRADPGRLVGRRLREADDQPGRRPRDRGRPRRDASCASCRAAGSGTG
jgi:membrane-bound serine protease (ClpP class)